MNIWWVLYIVNIFQPKTTRNKLEAEWYRFSAHWNEGNWSQWKSSYLNKRELGIYYKIQCFQGGFKEVELCSNHVVKKRVEKEMATHSSILAWRIPGTEEPGRLQSVGLHRVGHDWRDLAAAARRERQGFPGGSVVKNLLATAGDTGLITGLGRSHKRRSN